MTSPSFNPRLPQKLLYIAGVLLLLSGLAHVVVWLFLGGEWEGAVSWRKPILFGISTGLTVLSAAWLYPKIRPWRWDAYLCGTFGFALVAEVTLITMQQWRGVGSHFNHATAFDKLVENWMTYLIVFATVVLAEFTRRSIVSLVAPSDLKLAIRGGMAFLMASCLIGFAILFYGNAQVEIGADPSTFGRAGVTKFLHGVAIHAIQILPLVCWLLAKVGIPLAGRTRITGFLIASATAFLMFSLVQTLSGKARFDVTFSGTFLLFLTVIFLVPTICELVGFLWARSKPLASE